MAKQRDKPVGYAKYILALDCETTGLCFGTSDPSQNKETGEHHQAVSWGLVVVDSSTLEPVEELYIEIKWNEESRRQQKKDSFFGVKACEIHGLTSKYLEENGVDEETAVMMMGTLILKYWPSGIAIKSMGQNVLSFDIPFIRDLFGRFDLNLKFGARHYDSNSAGFAAFGKWNSNDLFYAIGLDDRGDHNALNDAKMSLEVFKRIRVICDSVIG